MVVCTVALCDGVSLVLLNGYYGVDWGRIPDDGNLRVTIIAIIELLHFRGLRPIN